MRTDRSNAMIVGVVGSRASLAALTTALRDAAQRHHDVEVVTVWAAPATVPGHDGGLCRSRAAHRRAVRVQKVATALATRPAGVPGPVTDVLDGHPAGILVQASAGASELVVGASRSRTPDQEPNAWVARRCLARTVCPVRVVRPTERANGCAPCETPATTSHPASEGSRHVGS